jgi:hypothetical protein
LTCRAERRRRAKLKYTWRPEYDAYLKAHYFGGLKRRFRVLSQMVRMTGLPRWYIKRQAARLGLTMHMDPRPWTAAELRLLENMVGRVLERLNGESRRRSKVIPRFPTERACLTLLYASLVTASKRWRGVRITAKITQQLQALRPLNSASPEEAVA